jgi:hypothetical protein
MSVAFIALIAVFQRSGPRVTTIETRRESDEVKKSGTDA